jgi:DNA polymerase III epsilon subunit-like protein/predicted flap endonuclease-1-like 5' DNA nuclease
MKIPNGICVDLETTIAGKVPDAVRPAGQKRYETRLLEVGAVQWREPTNTFGCIVNPIPPEVPLSSSDDLFAWLRSIYQKPEVTLNFWSRVLVHRDSLTRTMFRRDEAPLVWLGRTARNKAEDFVYWHNHPSEGPAFVTEAQALKGLVVFGAGQDWLAHNGKSFDYKVLEGCAQRTGYPIPSSVQQHDTLHLFRKLLPGHSSYSQPKLYSALFGQKYNAHVAIDDAKALTRICRHVMAVEPGVRGLMLPAESNQSGKKQRRRHRRAPATRSKQGPSRHMQLTFPKRPTPQPITPPPSTTVSAPPPPAPPPAPTSPPTPTQPITPQPTTPPRTSNIVGTRQSAVVPPPTLRQIKGIGPKSVAALAALSITTVAALKEQVETHGAEWLRDNLPFGVQWRVLSRTII